MIKSNFQGLANEVMSQVEANIKHKIWEESK